jgi:N-carbamoylputrescine amidase
MGDPEANLTAIERWAVRAHDAGATFAVFPEECITGSLNKSSLTFSEATPIVLAAERLAAERLEELSSRLNMTLAAGTIEVVGDRFGNHVVVYGPTGHLATFAKIHLPNDNERSWFVPGEHLMVVQSQGWTFGLGICSDLNYPEVFRAAARAGAEFILLAVGCSGNGTTEAATRYAEQYSRLMYPCAVANGLYIFYADQNGADRMSLAFAQDLDGRLVDVRIGEEGIVLATVSRDAILAAREAGDPTNVRYLRPEVYSNVRIVRA